MDLGLSATDYESAAEMRRLRREAPVIGFVDHLGYVVCLGCVVSRSASSPVHYGSTYSSTPCDKCGSALKPVPKMTDDEVDRLLVQMHKDLNKS